MVSLFVQAFIDGLLIVGAWKEIKVMLGIWLGFAFLGQAGLGWFIIKYLIDGMILYNGLGFFAFMSFAIFVVIKNIKLIDEGQNDVQLQNVT